MMCGLWFGLKKPIMNDFSEPFVEELKKLQNDGLNGRDNKNGVVPVKKTKVFTLTCSSDAEARCAMQNFKQFNGKFGCGFCEQEGERFFCRVYLFNSQIAVEGTFENSVPYASEALSTGKPFKGISVLMNLYPNFDMIDCFIPEYMHRVLLGVTR